MHNILKLFQLDVYRYDVYKSPNNGSFAKTNDTLIIVPFIYALTKTYKLIEFLKVEGQLNISVAGTRLIGPMTVKIGRASCRESVDIGGRRIIEKKRRSKI